MARALTKTARQALVQAVRERYQTGSRDARTPIREAFASVSGYHRKSAIRILNGATCPDEDKRGRRRPHVYDEAARQALLPILIPALERNGHLSLNAEFASKLETAYSGCNAQCPGMRSESAVSEENPGAACSHCA